MTRKPVAIVAVLLAAALPFAVAQEEPAESKLKIAFIAKSYANPVFVAAHRGAQDAAREYTTGKDIPVEVLVLTPTGEDPAQQAERIDKAVKDGAHAIAHPVAASEAAPVSRAIDDAVAGGVAVMTFDVDLPESRRFAYYGAENERTARRFSRSSRSSWEVRARWPYWRETPTPPTFSSAWPGSRRRPCDTRTSRSWASSITPRGPSTRRRRCSGSTKTTRTSTAGRWSAAGRCSSQPAVVTS